MIVAITGSRGLSVDMAKYIPAGTTKIITGGAKGIDAKAEDYARKKGISLEIIRPNYNRHHYKTAPLIRNKEIVDKADVVVAVWDGVSRGTKYTIDYAKKQGKKVVIHVVKE